jgi:APA family basic amino acid/polyamine antiporter
MRDARPRMTLLERSRRRFSITKKVEDVLDEADRSPNKLKRSLNVLDITAIGIGAIIGAGIFVLTGVAAALRAGPAIILSFIVAGIGCGLAALCYAEFASMIPISGSAYTYSYATLGELLAWIIGWDLILEYAVGAIAVAIGWSGYLVELFGAAGVELPVALTSGPMAGGVINLPAIFIVLLLTGLLVMGTRESAKINLGLVVVKIAIIIVVIVFGMSYVNSKNFEPFMPFGAWGVVGGAGLVFFAYIGFDAASTTAEEAKNPQRDLPIGIIGSLIISTALYIAAAVVLTGMVPYKMLNQAAPFAYAFSQYNVTWATAVISAGAIAGITSVLLISLLAQPRIFFSLSRDGLLPARISKVHPRFKTPYISTMITGGAVAIFAGILPIGVAAELTNIGTLFAFFLVSLGIILLRRSRPDLHRPFKVPLVPWLPLAGAGFCLLLMVSLPAITWYRFIAWLGIGLIIYANYGYHHSKTMKRARESGVGSRQSGDDGRLEPPVDVEEEE